MTTAPNTTFVDMLSNKTSHMAASVRSVCRSENRAAIDDEFCAGHVAMEPRFAAITRSQYSGSRFSAARRASGSLQTRQPRGLTLGQLVERRLLYPSHYDKPWVATSSETVRFTELRADGRVQVNEPVRRCAPIVKTATCLHRNISLWHARGQCATTIYVVGRATLDQELPKGAAELQRRRHT